jgi:hypothetical protein
MLELVVKDVQISSISGSKELTHEVQVLVNHLPPHLLMGLTVYLR